MADISVLRKKRSTCRSWLTKSINQAKVLLDKEEGLVIKEQLEIAFEDLKNRLHLLSLAQEQLEPYLEESEIDSDIDQSANYISDANGTLAKLLNRRRQLDTVSHTSGDGQQNTHGFGQSNTHGFAQGSSAGRHAPNSPNASLGPSQGYLPKINIGKFSGDFSCWQSFSDKFRALIDETSLPDISKFTYLQSFLEGDAEKAIEGLSITSENYKIALDILNTRFGRRERIVYGHIQNLLSIDFQTSNQSVKNLWKVFNSLQSNIRSLETLGVDGLHYGLILTPLIVSRLPSDIRLMWARQSHEKEDDLDFLMTFLQSEIENRERSQSFSQTTQNISNTQRDHHVRDFRPQHRHPGAGRVTRGSRASPASGIALNNSVAGRVTRGHRATDPSSRSSWTTFGAGRVTRGPKATTSTETDVSTDDSYSSCCAFCSGGHDSAHCRAVFKMNIDNVKSKIKENNLCFVCLGKGHIAKRCHSQCHMCKGRHNELFCKNETRGSNPVTSSGGTSTGNLETGNGHGRDHEVGSDSHVTFCQSKFSNVTTVLQTVTVKVNGIDLNILFDSGSDKSFITTKVVNKLKPSFVGRESVRMSGFGSKKPSSTKSMNVYGVTFDLMEKRSQKVLLTEVENISSLLYKPQIPHDLLSYFPQHCQFSPDVKTNRNVAIDILIGQDYYWQLIDVKEIIQSPSGLVAQKTHFGIWVLSGSYQEEGQTQRSTTYRQFLCLNDIPETHFRKLWDLDYLECDPNAKREAKSKVQEQFERDILLVEGRYEVSLPWVEEMKPQLLCNARQALVRLEGLEKKFSKNESLRDGYNEVLKGMENNGIIEEVVVDNDKKKLSSSDTGPVFYLPHRPVVKNSSATTKIRPVFDASAEGPNGVSLNDCMETGPNLLPLLSDILIRFRRHKIAVSADIEKAFLQISVRPEQRDVHRFFWKVNNDVRTMRITRVPFGNKCSPFLLNATVGYHLSSYESQRRVVKELSQNMYVDDWLSGGDSVEEVLDIVSDASTIMNDAGMKLTKWTSNSPAVAENMQRNFQDKSTGVECTKVLGVGWIPGDDALTFDGMIVSPDVLVTKRVILSCIARIFDPLGLISPFVVSIRILFQEVWTLGLAWDEQVPVDIVQQFSSWVKDLVTLKELSLARSFVSISWKEKRGVELHCFCDASLKAYGAVVYIKVIEADGSVSISLVLSKARVSPLKPITLPRLELLGAVIGAKLIHSVVHALQLPSDTKRFCWTDSTVALQWIKSDPTKWKMFVCNRVAQIQELTAPENWSHCSGKENPADCLSRGLSAASMLNHSLWFQGPKWLGGFQVEDETRGGIANFENESTTILEGVKEEIQSTVCLSKTNTSKSDEVLNPKRWGDFSKMVRIVAWIFRFANNSKGKKKGVVESGFLKTDELRLSKLRLLWYMQHIHFAEEIESLSKGQQVKKNSPLLNIKPFLDEDGIMRMTGRLQFSELPFEEKHPIILPRCHMTFLMVRREHISLKHGGVPQMMASLRNEFWIIGLRSLSKRVKRECVRCQRYDSSPCSQVMSPLPTERLTRAMPFATTGLDFAGPVYAADFVGKKFYILIFTCSATRAIHIELTESLSLKDFMYAFRRFISRRGMPNKVLSDNAKTFHAAAREINLRYSDESVKWIFNTPRAPWRGGIWERLVRSVKQSLKKTIGKRVLTRSELETVLIEIESCLNNRPLTYISDDPDCVNVLSPSHFLIGRSDSHKPPSQQSEKPILTGDDARDSYCHANKQMDNFWEIWHADYIRNLPHVKSSSKDNGLKVGSIVLLSEDNCPRMMWPLGKVVRLLPGKDGRVRTVEVKTTRGKSVRAVQKIHCLELENTEEPDEDAVEEIRTSRGRLVKPPTRLVL